MSLLTPDSGLLFWMLLSFGVVFFVLAKYGFPVITNMVDNRKKYIDEALTNAKAANEKMLHIQDECNSLLVQARTEQDKIISDAKNVSRQIIEDARGKAQTEAFHQLEEARKQIQIEKENALLDIRREVADLSLQIAEKVVRKDLSGDTQQMEYINRLLDEVKN